jgi:hypothetical protein
MKKEENIEEKKDNKINDREEEEKDNEDFVLMPRV